MTKEHFLSKVKELLDSGFIDFIMQRADKALKSGAINLEDYEDDYVLPKIFMSAMGEEIKWQYKPHDPKNLRVRNNLEKLL